MSDDAAYTDCAYRRHEERPDQVLTLQIPPKTYLHLGSPRYIGLECDDRQMFYVQAEAVCEGQKVLLTIALIILVYIVIDSRFPNDVLPPSKESWRSGV